MSSVHRPLADLAAAAVRAGARPVCFAGDCCAPIAVLAGLQRAGVEPVLVWLDAHGDFNTFETTISGFIGGMPLAMIVGRGEQALCSGVGLRPLPEDDVMLSDARDLDPAERVALEGSRVRHVPRPLGLLEALPAGRPIHVHFDTDILDPSVAPAMRYPVPGGLSLDECRRLMRGLGSTGRVAAVSMTVWETQADADRRTEQACLAALASLVE
jgi:arginase